MITVKHSFNAGDTISILPGLRKLWQDTGEKILLYQRLFLPAYYFDNAHIIVKDDEGNSVCMNEDMCSRLKPLIEAQEYIEEFKIWQGEEVKYDFDLTRDSKLIPMPSGEIYSWSWALFPEMATNLADDWIKICEIPNNKYYNKAIINRTNRYINPYITYFFLKDYEDRLLFSGTESEHELFCKQWNLKLELLVTKDFYELAQIIEACKFGIYNQSLNFHIAQSMHKLRILELCPQFPNTFCTGTNGYQFYRQQALEFYFNKLINK